MNTNSQNNSNVFSSFSEFMFLELYHLRVTQVSCLIVCLSSFSLHVRRPIVLVLELLWLCIDLVLRDMIRFNFFFF